MNPQEKLLKSTSRRPPIIAVIGDSVCDEGIREIAEEVGYLIARRKAYLLCGGYGGVMEAACKGAKRGGGITIGILSGTEKKEANPWIDIPIVTGLRDARNVIIARTADGVIAVSGGYGTLSEISFSLLYEVPLIGIRSWKLEHLLKKAPSFQNFYTAKEAVESIFKLL